jgi:hypothetical protein
MSYSIKMRRLARRAKFSVFHECTIVEVENLDPALPDEPPETQMQIESVYYEGDDPEDGKTAPIAMYIVVDGKRMAKRANCQWLSIVPGFAVYTENPPHLTMQ